MRLAEIERQVGSMEELMRIVGAMRVMASVRMQEAAHALDGVRDYGEALLEGVREALAIALEQAPRSSQPGRAERTAARQGRCVRIVFLSEHGFVGGFNERLIEAVHSRFAAADAVWALGSRGAALLEERGRPADWTRPMATRLASLPELVRELQSELYARLARGDVPRAEVLFGQYERSGAVAVVHRALFPLEVPPRGDPGARFPPLHNLPAPELLERLTSEYLIAQLTEAATESLAAENAARFAAMASAHDNVARKLETLRLDVSSARQEEITTELLDLVTGTRALR